ncbi:L-aspartate oxidase [Rhizobium sp.]|jgi:L-aspartate oxidase|uniref:L-aspartate oxidase n=1 Tax=Rhizobium sp. TaxID=391 RepID=UPI000E9F568F|nr:L-aspartate oxidase [Rhizobium sp.]
MSTILNGVRNPVVVIGSGLAGLVTALWLAPQPVLLITRAGLGAETSSQWAQGGIAASVGDDDTAELHANDTCLAGDGLCDATIVRLITSEAPAAIAMLESFGVQFDRDDAGRLIVGLEAAHARRRIVHVGGDGAGAAIMRALVQRVLRTPSITVMAGAQARRLVTVDGCVTGVLCVSNGHPVQIAASRVVLATGGLGGLNQATTNPVGNYGQGIMLAARAGAVLADMEFVQFHPTALDTPSTPLTLVSEAVRGEGAVLVNEHGERFLANVPGAELAARDVVARAISAEIARGGKVFLDARQALGAGFAKRFPLIDAACRDAGIDPALVPIPVRPAVHYHMGGVATDSHGRTSITGLWAAGEVACTGLHGANRLASNSLLEAAVMGMRVADDMTSLRALPMVQMPVPTEADLCKIHPLVSSHLGVLRHADGLRQAITALLPMVEADDETSDPAIVALSIAVFASLRQESRGGHARLDYPAALPTCDRQFMGLSNVLDRAHEVVSDGLKVVKSRVRA